jgi:predicted ATPase
MSYISSININADRSHPYPYNVPAIKNAKNIDLSNEVTFLIGENGTGKSTLLEAIAYRLQLPHLDGTSYDKKCFDAAKTLLPFLEIEWAIERSVGFFFRAEDFGDFLNSIHRVDANLHNSMADLKGEVPKHIIDEMKESANYQLKRVRKNYGQELDTFSHGEAYMHIMRQMINTRGIYLLDEPEAALSPAKQLAFMYFIKEHIAQFNSQFIIATHSPMLMAFPEATIFEITENELKKTPLEQTEHYTISKSFLNNPNAYFRHFE